MGTWCGRVIGVSRVCNHAVSRRITQTKQAPREWYSNAFGRTAGNLPRCAHIKDESRGDRQLFSIPSLLYNYTCNTYVRFTYSSPGMFDQNSKLREFVDGPPCSFFFLSRGLWVSPREEARLRLIVYLLGDAKPAIMAAVWNGHGVTLSFGRFSTQHSKLASALLCCARHQNLWPLCLIEITVREMINLADRRAAVKSAPASPKSWKIGRAEVKLMRIYAKRHGLFVYWENALRYARAHPARKCSE